MKPTFMLALLALAGCLVREQSLPDISQDWAEVTTLHEHDRPQIDPNDWSYPWYMIRHADGHFENTADGVIRSKDTVRLPHFSQCYMFSGNDTLSRLPFSEAHLADKSSILVRLFDESASTNLSLTLAIQDLKKFKPTYRCRYIFPTDSITVEIHRQTLALDPATCLKGDTLMGYVDIELTEKIYRAREKRENITHNIRLKGPFAAIVK